MPSRTSRLDTLAQVSSTLAAAPEGNADASPALAELQAQLDRMPASSLAAVIDWSRLDEMMDQVYREGGNYEGPIPMSSDNIPPMHPEGETDVSYSDAYINRADDKNDNIHRSMRRVNEMLNPIEHSFDALVVTGMSGVIPGAIWCYAHGKQLVVVRKDEDNTHGVRLEGSDHFAVGTPYVILDDFIGRGSTMRRIFQKLYEYGHGPALFVALYRGFSLNDIEFELDDKPYTFRGKWTRDGLYEPVLHRGYLPFGGIHGHIVPWPIKPPILSSTDGLTTESLPF